MKLDYTTGTIAVAASIILLILLSNVVVGDDISVNIATLILVGAYGLVIAGVFAFWLIMLADCLKRPVRRFPQGGGNDRLIWVLIIFFVHFFGAVFYYYLVYSKDPM